MRLQGDFTLTRNATQYSDLPVKILKENSDILGKYISDFFNECVDKGTSTQILHQFLKKDTKVRKTVIGQ